MMEIPDGATLAALDGYYDSDEDDDFDASVKAALAWLVENDPGFLLRLVFSEEELRGAELALSYVRQTNVEANTRSLRYAWLDDVANAAAKLRSALREPERSG